MNAIKNELGRLLKMINEAQKQGDIALQTQLVDEYAQVIELRNDSQQNIFDDYNALSGDPNEGQPNLFDAMKNAAQNSWPSNW